jgi:hypothetical protein
MLVVKKQKDVVARELRRAVPNKEGSLPKAMMDRRTRYGP